MRIPIAVKYSLLVLSAIILTSGLLSWYFLDYMKEQLQSELYKRGESITRHLAYTVAPLLLSKDDAKISATLKNVMKEPDIKSISVLDHEHRIVADTWPERIGQKHGENTLENDEKELAHNREDQVKDQLVFLQVATFSGVKVGSVVVNVSRSTLRAAIESATNRVLYITGIIACLVILASFVTLGRTIKPLAQVLEGTKRISRGDFSTRLELRSKDEIGELASAFNDMAARTELFFRYVDKSIAERLVRDESLAKPGGELKQVSVLFGDMREFTAMSNLRSPSDVVLILNSYFDLLFRVVHYFDGVVDKTMGDAIMAFFERSSTQEADNCRRATLAAVSMRAAVLVLNNIVEIAERIDLKTTLEPRNFGFAVATGRLIVGNIGSDRRLDYTVCGPAVNLAARLQDETGRGEVVLDKFTAAEVDRVFVLRKLNAVRPKGFLPSQKVIPYQVVEVLQSELGEVRNLMSEMFSMSFFSRHFSSMNNGQIDEIALRRLHGTVLELVEDDEFPFLVS